MIAIAFLVLVFSCLTSAQFTLITFFGYPAPKQAVYGVSGQQNVPYVPQQPQQPVGYPYCPPVYAAPPIYPVYPVFAGPAVMYPQPYPYPYPPQQYPPQYTTTTTTTTPYPDYGQPDPNNPNNPNNVNIQLRAAKQQQYIPNPAGTYVPLKPGMRPGQEYSIPIIGKMEFTALTTAGVRVEGIAGSNRIEGLSKQRHFIVNDTLIEFSQVKSLEVRWTPTQYSQQTILQLNARRIFVSGVRMTDAGPVKTAALFSRCGRTTEMEPIKNYNFYRSCFKFSLADQQLIDYFKGSGLLCEEMDPPITNKKCIEDESKDYLRLYGQAPAVTIPPSSVTGVPIT